MQDGDIVFESSYKPDPACAREVLAFVLTPVSAFARRGSADRAAVTIILREAKEDAIKRWRSMQRKAR